MLKIFAQDLKAIREKKNITLKSISQQTRLNMTTLENLESGDYTFQPQAYIRAFLKQYIACLEIDVDETLFEYDLARSGKYKSSRSEEEIKRQNEEAERLIAEEEALSGDSEEIISIEEGELASNNTEDESVKKPAGGIKVLKINPDGDNLTKGDPTNIRSKNTVKSNVSLNSGGAGSGTESIRRTVKTQDGKPSGDVSKPAEKKSFSFSFLGSRVFRNVMLILFIVLALAGLYSLVNILFLEGGNDNPEIIRQNFDDVVKEQEKKLLGKKTEEEIQDSIRKAQEELTASRDSISLSVTALTESVYFIVTDSSNYSRPDKFTVKPKEVKSFRAAKSFHISAANTKSIKVSLNGNPVKFEKNAVSKIKLTKDGVSGNTSPQ
ncbi:MAG: helix-turn-helix domain-containing protein [Ignavibacteria bacterium]|nr:helix-turn-helix domain-containing protein [Ignavibacteria bacterium]